MNQNNSLAKKFNLYTIIAVYFLILVGGIVRSMGAGMGCPDWPKCFGSYIPPANEELLPDNYKDIYVEARVKKNERLAKTLSVLGFQDLAQRVSGDPNIRRVTEFDVQKAWVEYVNRLVGVVIGFLIIVNMVLSFKQYFKSDRRVVTLSVMSFILVVFQGWIGSLVVSTNLLPGFISFHMMLAILLVALLLTQRYLMTGDANQVVGRSLIVSLLVLFTIQIAFGVQVREEIDWIKSMTDHPRSAWIDQLGVMFYVHRTYSLLIAGLTGFLIYQNWKKGALGAELILLGCVIIAEILLGVILSYFGMPAFVQPLHLLLGTIAFGVIFYLFLSTNLKVKHS